MDETLNIGIKINTNGLTGASGVSSISKSFNTLKSQVAGTTANLTGMQRTLRTIAGVNIGSAITQSLKNANRPLKNLIKDLSFVKDMKGQMKESKKIGDTEGLETFTEEANSGMKDIRKNLKQILADIGKFLIRLTSIITAISAMLTTMAIKVAKLADDIKDNSQKVYLSTTAYQEWGYVLQQNGVQISSLTMLMRTFAKNASTNTALLEKYGITGDSISDKFANAVFYIQSLENETQKVAVATELFGTRMSELMPIFNSNRAETEKLMKAYRAIGATMSNELIAKGDELSDNITLLKASWQGLKNTLAESIIPVVNKVVVGLIQFIVKVRNTIAGISRLSSSYDSIATSATEATSAVETLTSSIMGFDEMNTLSGNGTADALDEYTGSLMSALKLSIDEIDFDAKFDTKKIKTALITVVSGALMYAGLSLFPVSAGANIGISLGVALTALLLTLAFDNKDLKSNEIFESLQKALIPAVVAGFGASLLGFFWKEASIIMLTMGVLFSLQMGFKELSLKDGANQEMYDAIQQAIKDMLSFAVPGTLIGFILGGAKGAVIGMTIGLSIGLVVSFFLDKVEKTTQEVIDEASVYAYTPSGTSYLPTITKKTSLSLPKRAIGGIVNSPTAAIVGEAGSEAILPLENNTGWMDDLADRINNRNSAPSKLVMNVDGKTFGTVAIDSINSITKQTGSLGLVL